MTVPIVPAAILFDLLNGGNKSWQRNPYRELGLQALESAAMDFSLGSAGAGFGATTLDFRGGLGSVSAVTVSGFTLGALVAVNAFGSVAQNGGPHFWASPFELGREFGGLGPAGHCDPEWEPARSSMEAQGNTTIAVVATDADLSKAQGTRLAVASHAGMARAIVPSHTVFDGDVVFAVATGKKKLERGDLDILEICHAGAACLARATARGVYEAEPDPSGPLPSWREAHL